MTKAERELLIYMACNMRLDHILSGDPFETIRQLIQEIKREREVVK